MNTVQRKRGDEGFTLLELMFTAGIMTVGIVMLMSSVINISHQSRISETAVLASHFNTSVLESMRGRSLDGLLQFNSDEAEFDVSDSGKVYIEHLGDVTVYIWCVMEATDGTMQQLAIPMTTDEMDALTDVPNPIEIKVETSLGDYTFMTSGLFYY